MNNAGADALSLLVGQYFPPCLRVKYCFTYIYHFVQHLESEELPMRVRTVHKDVVYTCPGIFITLKLVENHVSPLHLNQRVITKFVWIK